MFCKACTTSLTSYVTLYQTLNSSQTGWLLTFFKYLFRVSITAVQPSPLCRACSAPKQLHCISLKQIQRCHSITLTNVSKLKLLWKKKKLLSSSKFIILLKPTCSIYPCVFVKIWRKIYKDTFISQMKNVNPYLKTLSSQGLLASILGFKDIRTLWQWISDRPDPIN